MLTLALATMLSVAADVQSPAVRNAGFENDLADLGWETHVDLMQTNGRPPSFSIDRNANKEGTQSLLIEGRNAVRASVSQKIFLPVGSLWRAKAWVKTEDLNAGDQSNAGEYFRDPPPTGGFISIETITGDVGASPGTLGSTPWHEEETMFRVPSPGYIHLTLVGMHNGTGKVWFDGVRLETLPTTSREAIRISASRISKRPVNPMQQGQFIEILCMLIPSMLAQQVFSTSFEEIPPCIFAYKKEVDDPYRPWYPDGAVHVARYSYDTTNPFNGHRSPEN